MSLHKGDVVTFDFTIEHPVAGRKGERRAGIGVIADNEVNYQCWPPGRSVSVQSSENYKPGTIIAVAGHNLRKLQGESSPRQHSTMKQASPPSWKQIAADYKRIAAAAKKAGGKCVRTPDGSILIVPTKDSDEYFYQDWQADELIEKTKRDEKDVLKYISIEDLLLAKSQGW